MRKTFIVLLLLMGWAMPCAWGQQEDPVPTAEELAKIKQAIPETARAVPKKPRQLLVYTNTDGGYRHKSIPYSVAMLTLMGEKTGAFHAVHTEDKSIFTPERLAAFDGICFCNSTNENFSGQTVLEDFIRSGKGIISIHAGMSFNKDWTEGIELYCGLFDGHPWRSNGTWQIKLEDPDHPLMAAFGGKDFKLNDEIYRHVLHKLRQRCRVLMGLDLTDPVNLAANGVRPEDRDIPITWLRSVGQGRLFVCTLGHNNHIYWNPAIVQHYLDGIQFALGDLEADATPLPSPENKTGNEVDSLLKQLRSYEIDQSHQPWQRLHDVAIQSLKNPAARSELEQRLLAFLQADATNKGKEQVCRVLREIGTEASAKTLGEMLTNPETSDMARYALENIPGPAVDRILRDAVSQATGSTRTGIITSLGMRKDDQAVEVLIPLLSDSDSATAATAMSALGQIGGNKAAAALAALRQKTPDALRANLIYAYLQCADHFVEQGDMEAAKKIYTEVFLEDLPSRLRVPALHGLALTGGDYRGQVILDALQKGDAVLRAAAIGMLAMVENSEWQRKIAGQVPSLPPAQQIQLMTAFGENHLSAGRSAVKSMLGSRQGDVRQAALWALGQIGQAEDVRTLAAAAARTQGTEQSAARDALDVLAAPGVDDAIVRAVPDSDPAVQVELFRAIGERHIEAGGDILMEKVRNDNLDLSVAALRALRQIGQDRHIEPLLGLLQDDRDPVRREAANTINTLIDQSPDQSAVISLLSTRYQQTDGSSGRQALLEILGQTHHDLALPLLRQALKDEPLQATALRQLSDWPTGAPIDDLYQAAQTMKSPGLRTLALRGFIRLVGLDEALSSAARLRKYQDAMKLASEVNERKLILSGLANVPTVEALNTIKPFLDDDSLKLEAQVAAVAIGPAVQKANPELVLAVMQKIAAEGANDELKQQAQKLIN